MDTSTWPNRTVPALILLQRGSHCPLTKATPLSPAALLAEELSPSTFGKVCKRIMRRNTAQPGLEQTDSSCVCQQPPMPLWLQGETQRSTTDTLALHFVLTSYQSTPLAWHLQRGSAHTIDSAPQACGLKSETEL